VTLDILAGRRVRRIDVELAPGLTIAAIEAADVDTVLDDALAGDADPYAAILWPSAIAAASRLAAMVEPGETVLDIGAGTGLAALTAARLGARAIALDHDAFAREVLKHATSLQQLNVDVRPFDVRSDVPLPDADIVVIADLLYEPELARAAAHRTLEALAGGATVLVGDPRRYGRAEFERILEIAGVRVTFGDVVVRAPGESRTSVVGLAVLKPPVDGGIPLTLH
jgi:predicted nicotinamide N-methyase